MLPTAKLIAQAVKLFDPPTVETREIIAAHRKAEQLLEQAVKFDPTHVEAVYTLAFAYDTARVPADGAPQRIAQLNAQVLALTADIPIVASASPPIEARARSFALAWRLPEQAAAARSVAEAVGYQVRAQQAATLRESPWTQRALLGAEAGLAFARAHAGAVEDGYRWLLAWVKQHPSHSSYPVSPHHDPVPVAAGLEPFFENEGFVAWARRQAPRTPVPRLAPGMALAVGGDKLLHAYLVHEPARFGRLGRVLALRALGCPLDATLEHPGFGSWCTVEIAAQMAPSLLPELTTLGVSLDRGRDGTPPLVALTSHGSADAVAALLAAGASRDAKDPGGHTALDVARTRKRPAMLQILGAARPTAALDTSAVRDLLRKLAPKLRTTAWAKRAELSSVDDVEELLETIAATGVRSWGDAAELIDRLEPAQRLLLASLLRQAVPAGKPTKLTKVDGSSPRIILGDLEVKGVLGLSSASIVTGSVRCDAYLDDETASLSIGGGLACRYVHTEGELWIGEGLDAEVCIADYEAGELFVTKALTTTWFFQGQHGVDAGKLAAKTKVKLSSTSAASAAAHFPAAAFVNGSLSAGRLWKQLQAGTWPKARSAAARR